MEGQSSFPSAVTKGILIGHELADWSGFTSGRLIVEETDGKRVEFRFGKDSLGEIPKIGSLMAIEYTQSSFPEIIKIVLIENYDGSIYRERVRAFESSLFMEKSPGATILVLTLVSLGLVLILFGLISGVRNPLAPMIYGICGAPYLIIGYLLWFYMGD